MKYHHSSSHFPKSRRRYTIGLLILCVLIVIILAILPHSALGSHGSSPQSQSQPQPQPQPQPHDKLAQSDAEVLARRTRQQQEQLAKLEDHPELREQMEHIASRIEETLEHYAKHTPPPLMRASPRNPVILVPGIGGSTMWANATSLRQVWITLFSAEANMKTYMWAEYDDLAKETRSLLPGANLHAPKDNHGLDSIQNLDPSLVWPLSAITDYFGTMIKVMTKTYGYEIGTTLFGFPFDWRQSNYLKSTLHELHALVKRAYELNDGRRVHLVSHSMGGLLLRAYVDVYHADFEKYIEKWVTIATPHQGAPGLILQEILKGYNLGNVMISASVAHSLAMRCPSVLELFPNEFFPWNPTPPTISYTFKETGAQVVIDPSNYVVNITSALETNTIVFDGKTIPQPFRKDMWQDSVNVRKRFSTVPQLPSSVAFYNIYGVGRKTPFSIQYTQPIVNPDLSDLKTAKSEFVNVDGDETVPVESGFNDGFKNTKARVPVKDSHFALVANKQVFQNLFCWLVDDCPKGN